MANALYPEWKEDLLAGGTTRDLDNDTVDDGPYVALYDVGAGGAYDSADEFYSAVEAGQVGDDMRIATPTVANGLFDGANVTFTAVSGAECEALIIFRHNNGASSTWPLVAYLDTSITGLPVTPNSGDITVTWNASGIFQL
jgi:hypothetical protein